MIQNSHNTSAKDVLPNIKRTQAAKVTPGSDGMVPSAAAWCCLQWAHYNASCSRMDYLFVAGGDGSAQHVFVPGDLDLWPWHSYSSEWGTKHVFHVNLAQIHSAVPEIFDSQTKKNKLEMWANAQSDGRPAEYRWRPLFNAAKFGRRPLLECRAVTLPTRETRWN